MDNSGKNRYELLFMDDDGSDPLDNIAKKKVKQPAGPGASAAAVSATAVTSGTHQTKGSATSKHNADSLKKNASQLSSEKENKSFAMNKNVDNRKSTGNNAASGQGGGSNGSVSKSVGGKSGQHQQTQQLSNNNQNANRSNRDNNNAPATTTRNNNSKPQNGETREQRNNRRNRENGVPGSMGGIGEYNNDSQIQRMRQNNQRFGGPPRNRSGAEGVRGGKREFDRQSGSDKTGVKAIDKRDGAGAHNWGSVKQDIEDINKSNDEAGLTDKEESGNDQTTEQNASIDEETKELTLDEWKAQRQQRAKPQFNIRKAGEGEDVTQWKKMIALNNKKKAGGNEGDSEEELEYDPSMYPQRVGRLQRVLDIQFHFNDGRRGGGGMGRGRGRGSRPTGGAERPVGGAGGVGAAVVASSGRPEGPRVNVGRPRNENPRREGGGIDKQQRGGQHAPKVDDERQFPTLS